jgi:hypothetical protein
MTPHRIRIAWPIAAAALLLCSAAARADDGSNPAQREAAVAALEAKCEAEREARIKPLRDMEIAKCKKTPTFDHQDDPDYCERYWKDYGNAMRIPNGAMTPRMFDDLPDCVAAFKARKALINDENTPGDP